MIRDRVASVALAAITGRIAKASSWRAVESKASDLLQADETQSAFALDKEPETLRDRYGRNRFGQSVLLARRLVESGVSLVQVNWTRWEDDENVAPAWDTHAKHNERLKKALMPPMDQAYSALLEDLEQRGMLEDTLVVWMGEFGRSPKFNAAGGRDHWGHVFSVALAGGGVRGGSVYPSEHPLTPADIAKTVYYAAGIDDLRAQDSQGRPYNLLEEGQPIKELFG